MIYRTRKRKEMVGYKMGKIYISEELASKFGNRRYILKCEVCGSEKPIYHSQLNSGNWNVCEHDIL